MKNYDIEMWRYAKMLKTYHKELGHVHVPNKSAMIQGVEISLNSLGMRSAELKIDVDRRILFLGSSITLGWGLEKQKGVCEILNKKFSDNNYDVEILNGSIGNYNSYRYVELFFEKYKDIQPTDIVVQYFINDAEVLTQGEGNWLLQNSQLVATTWITLRRFFITKNLNLETHYNQIYDREGEGFKTMKKSLKKLSDFAKQKNIRIYLVMTPEIHHLTDYPFNDIHKQMRHLSSQLNYKYLDLLNSLKGIPFEKLQIIPGDSHPNELGHQIFAEEIYKLLQN